MSIKTMLVDKLQMAFGDYVEGLTPENLQMQVLAGTIEQRNLKLKKEALDSLNLPISVKAGYLARFHVRVPWRNLSKESVVVAIEDLYLVAEPNYANATAGGGESAAERMESLRTALELRLKRIAEREMLRQAMNETMSREGGSEDSSMAERLGRIVLNNLQVTISNVYARFEDVPEVSPAAVTEVNVDATKTGSGMPQRFTVEACVRRMMQGAIRPTAAAWVPGEDRHTGCILDEEFDFQEVRNGGPEDVQTLVQQLRDAIAKKPRTSAALRPVAMGLKMSELRIHTIDEEGKETFQTEGVAQNKQIRLRGLEVYSENPRDGELLSRKLSAGIPAASEMGAFFSTHVGHLEAQAEAAALMRKYIVSAQEDILLRAKWPDNGTKEISTTLEGLQLHWDRVQHEDVERLGRLFASLSRPPLQLPSCLGYRPSKRKHIKNKNKGQTGPGSLEHTMSVAEVQEEWAEAFRLVDESRRGSLNQRGILTALRAVNCHPTELPAPGVEIDSAEFISMAAKLHNDPTTVGSKESFDVLDVAGDGGEAQDGFLSALQIQKWVNTLALEPELTNDEVEIIVREGQAGGDGQVDFEWCQYGLQLVRDLRRYQELFVRNYDVITSLSGSTAVPVWAEPDDEIEVKMLEARVDPKYLMLARTFAEKKNEAEAVAAQRSASKKKKKKTRWFGGSSTDASTGGTNDEHALTEEEEDALRHAIMATVDDTPIEGDETFISHDIQLKVSISVALSSGEDVVRVNLPAASAGVKLYPFDEKTEITVEMDCVTIDDCRLPPSAPACYRRIVGPLALPDASRTTPLHQQHFLRLKYTALPQEKTQLVDMAVETPLLYVHSPGVLKTVKEIFATSAAAEELPDHVSADVQAAQDAMHEFSARRKAQLKRRLAERDKVKLTARVATPVILIPANRHIPHAPCLAFSPGTLDVDGGQIEATDEIDKRRSWRPVEKTFLSDQHEVVERQTDVTITEHIELDVKGMQVLLMPCAVDDWVAALAQEDDKHRLLQRVDLKLRAYAGSEPIQRLAVQCELGEFGVVVSRQQINNLVCIKDALTSQNEQGQTNEPVPASEAASNTFGRSGRATTTETESGPGGAGTASDYSRFVEFDCPALTVTIRADDGLKSVAALNIWRPKVGIALSPDCKQFGFTLQGINASAIEKPTSDGLNAQFLDTPVGSTVDDLVRVYFKEVSMQREVDVKMENIDMTWHPQSVASIQSAFVEGLAQAPAPPTQTGYQARLAKLKAGYRNASSYEAASTEAVVRAGGTQRQMRVQAGLQGFTITLAQNCAPFSALYEFKMTSANVSYKTEATGQQKASLSLRNLQVLHHASTNYPELVGLNQESTSEEVENQEVENQEVESLVEIEYMKNPPENEGTRSKDSHDSLLTLKLSPLRIHAIMSCVDELNSYVGTSLQSLKNKRDVGSTQKTLPETKQTRDIVQLTIQSPTLLVANSSSSYQWHEIKPGDLSIVKDGANLTVEMQPDADTGLCTASVTTVGDFKGSAMELFRIQANEMTFCIKKGVKQDDPLVHAEFSLTGQFWNLRHSRWEMMLEMKDLLLEVTEQTPPLLGYEVRFEPKKSKGIEHLATVKVSGALVYSGIQYLKCKDSSRVQPDQDGVELSVVQEGNPPGSIGQARILNKTGTMLSFYVQCRAVDGLDPQTVTKVPGGGEVALSTAYGNSTERYDNPSVLAVQLDGWSMCAVDLNQCGEFDREIRRESARESEGDPWHDKAVCVFSISLIDGAMVVTCRSTLVICNAAAIDVDVKMVDRRNESEPLTIRGTDWSVTNSDGSPIVGYVAVDSAHCEDVRIKVSTTARRGEASLAAEGWSDKPLVVPVAPGASTRSFARKFQSVQCIGIDKKVRYFMCEVVTTAASRRVTISAPFAVENLLPMVAELGTSLTGSKLPPEKLFIHPGRTQLSHTYSAKSIEDTAAMHVHLSVDGFEPARANLSFSGSNELNLRSKDGRKQKLPVKLQFLVSKDGTVTLRIMAELLLVNRMERMNIAVESSRWNGPWAQKSYPLTLPRIKGPRETLTLHCSTPGGAFSCLLNEGSEFTGYRQLDGIKGVGNRSHCVTIGCQFGPGSYDDTKVITVLPRYAVINHLDAAVCFRAQSQGGLKTFEEESIMPSESIQIHTLQTATLLSKNHPVDETSAAAQPRDGLTLEQAIAWCQSMPDCAGMWYYDNGRTCPKAHWDPSPATFSREIPGGAFYQVKPMSGNVLFDCKAGALSGHDLEVGTYTLHDACLHALTMQACVGFTYEGVLDQQGKVECFFKSSEAGNSELDPSWQTYLKKPGAKAADLGAPAWFVDPDRRRAAHSLFAQVTVDGWTWPSDLAVAMDNVESHFVRLTGHEGQSRFVQIQVRRSTTEAEFVLEIKPATEAAENHIYDALADTDMPHTQVGSELKPEPEPEPAGLAVPDAEPARQNNIHIEMPDLNISFDAFDHPGSIHDSRLEEDEIRELRGEELFSIIVDDFKIDLCADSGVTKKTTVDISMHDLHLVSAHDFFDGTETGSCIQAYTRSRMYDGGFDARPLFRCEKCSKDQRVGVSEGLGALGQFLSSGRAHLTCREEGCTGKLWDPKALSDWRKKRRDPKHDLAKLRVEISNEGDLKIFENVDVTLKRDISAEVTDMFLLKLMEISKNLTRFQTGASAPPFRPWAVMDYWQTGVANSALRLPSFRQNASPDGPVSAEAEVGTMLFRRVHISVLNAHVTFKRVSDRGSHLFKIPMYGPIPKGLTAQLQSLGFDDQLYCGISGNIGSLVRVIKAAYISNATSAVKSRLTPSLLAGATSTIASDALASKTKALLKTDTTGGGSIDRMKFEKKTMQNNQIFLTHFKNAATIPSAQALLEEGQHMAFDWAYNHQGASARTCIVVAVLNRSARPVAVNKSEGTLVTGTPGAGCEVSNTQLMPCRSTSDWDPAQCTMVFAYGTKLDVKCTLHTTAFQVECGVEDGMDETSLKPAPGFHVTIEYAESTKWWAIYSISIMDDMSVEHMPTVVTAYENQRRIAVLGIGGDWSADSLLPTDRGPWSDREGTVEYAGLDDPALLPRGTEWAPGSDWHAKGWYYANVSWQTGWTSHCALADMIRRRNDSGAWERAYILPEYDSTVAADLPRHSAASGRASAASDGPGGGHSAELSSDDHGSMPPPPRFTVTEDQIAGFQRVLAKSSRSTLILLDNQTPWPLRLANSHCDSGSFPGNGKPVPRIRPNELVMCGSISKWVGDAEGSLSYCTDASSGPGSDEDTVYVKWKNPMVDDPLSDRGKWAHAGSTGRLDLCWTLADGTFHCQSEGGNPRPTQELNNRLELIITMRGRTSAPWKQQATTEQTAAEKARANPRWISSSESKACMLCKRPFGRFTDLKHHCRRCGWAVCDNCSPNKLVLHRWLEEDKPHALRETTSPKALRICLICHDAELASRSAPQPEPQPDQ